jgi:hypothetical protein
MAQIQTLEGLSAAQISQSDPDEVAATVSSEIGKLTKQRNIAIGVGVAAVAFQAWWWLRGGSSACSARCQRLTGGGGY